MVVLALDTSHPLGQVSLRLDERTCETMSFGSKASHLVELGETVSKLVARAGIAITDLERLAVVEGPGSFTGLRIGMAFAKGLHAALGASVVTMTGLELLAVEVLASATEVCAMIDARRAEVYAGVYGRGDIYRESGAEPLYRARCEVPPRAARPEAFLLSLENRPMLFVGSGARHWQETIRRTAGARVAELPAQPSTELLSRLATWMPPLPDERVPELEPFYIRPSDAKLQPLRRVETHE